MGRPLPKRSPVALAGTGDVLSRYSRERQHLDGVDFDLESVALVTASYPDLGPLPQSDRQSDVAACDAFAQLRAEPHSRSQVMPVLLRCPEDDVQPGHRARVPNHRRSLTARLRVAVCRPSSRVEVQLEDGLALVHFASGPEAVLQVEGDG